jgi:hypothetical protein
MSGYAPEVTAIMRKDVTPLHSLVDRRVVERNIRKGILSREEYQTFLDGLKDVANNAETVRARLGVDDEPVEVDAIDDDEDDVEDEDDDEG